MTWASLLLVPFWTLFVTVLFNKYTEDAIMIKIYFPVSQSFDFNQVFSKEIGLTVHMGNTLVIIMKITSLTSSMIPDGTNNSYFFVFSVHYVQ